jgi:hypothetical protein
MSNMSKTQFDVMQNTNNQIIGNFEVGPPDNKLEVSGKPKHVIPAVNDYENFKNQGQAHNISASNFSSVVSEIQPLVVMNRNEVLGIND